MGSSRAPNSGVTYIIFCAFCALCVLASAVLCDRAFAGEATDQIISAIQLRLEHNPKDLKALLTLGDAYARKGRETGDARYFGLAEQALRKAVDIHPNHAGSRRHLAYVLSLGHEFQRAAEEAQRATELDPKDSDAYGVLGDMFIELGDYLRAEQVYQQMAALRENLASLSRLSGLKSLKGDSRGAVADLERAIMLGQERGEPAESIAWAQWQLGVEHFNVGRIKQAEKSFRDALATYPNYYRATAGLGQVSAARGHYAPAITYYEAAMAVVPIPDYAIALGDLQAKLGNVKEANKHYEFVEYLAQLNSKSSALYNREFVLFHLDRGVKLAESLELAEKELTVRRDIYGYDVHAWALYKSGRFPDARQAIDEALKLGTQDARLFFHAGMIYAGLGERRKAREFLKRALAINPHFHLLHAELAKKGLRDLAKPKRKD